jgi:hypothetical protein
VEVGEGDLPVEAAVSDEGEELLESGHVVVKRQAAVGEVDPQQLDHEALALELGVPLAPLAHPPLGEPDELREVHRMLLLPTADEVEVLADAREQLLAGVLVNEVANVVRLTLIEDRYDVDAQAASGEGDGDAVGVGDDLVGRQR